MGAVGRLEAWKEESRESRRGRRAERSQKELEDVGGRSLRMLRV